MSQNPLQADWNSVPEDPDPVADLGYLLLDLEFISTPTSKNQVIVLPRDESLLHGDAFLVVDEDSIADLADWR